MSARLRLELARVGRRGEYKRECQYEYQLFEPRVVVVLCTLFCTARRIPADIYCWHS